MNQFKILSIVVTFNGEHWIDKCLGSLKNSLAPNSIMVIDNGSTDNTVNRIKKDYPEVRLIESNQNLGFGKANNLGLLNAKKEDFDYVFLLNQDAWIKKNTLQRLSNLAKENPSYGIYSPLHLNANGKIDRLFRTYLPPQYFLDNEGMRKIYETDFVNAASWFIPVNTISKVGLFDPIFFHYGEDVNYCQRVLYNNLKIAILPELKIVHDRGERKKKKSIQYNIMINEAILLQILTNINIKYTTALNRYIFFIVKAFVKNFFLLDWRNLFALIIVINRYLNKVNTIKDSRERNRTINNLNEVSDYKIPN